MKQFFHISILSLCLLLLSSSLLQAQEMQEVLLLRTQTLDKQASVTSAQVYLTEDKVLLDVEGQDESVLFDAEKEEMYVINHKKKEYILLTKAEMEQINAHLSQSYADLQQQLERLPESQRKMLDQQMKIMALGSEKLSYAPETSDVLVKGWICRKWVGKAGDQLRHELCLVSYKELGEEQETFHALLKFNEWVRGQLQHFAQHLPNAMGAADSRVPGSKEGLPVKSIYYDQQGKPEYITSLESIEQAEVAEDIWIIPDNYRQKKLTASLD